MEHIEMKNSLDSKLQILSIFSIRIRSRTRDIFNLVKTLWIVVIVTVAVHVVVLDLAPVVVVVVLVPIELLIVSKSTICPVASSE